MHVGLASTCARHPWCWCLSSVHQAAAKFGLVVPAYLYRCCNSACICYSACICFGWLSGLLVASWQQHCSRVCGCCCCMCTPGICTGRHTEGYVYNPPLCLVWWALPLVLVKTPSCCHVWAGRVLGVGRWLGGVKRPYSSPVAGAVAACNRG